MLADAIDFPIVLLFGLIVLVPLLLFEVSIEALVLKKLWGVPFRQLCFLTFFANCWSLLAGIPVKFLNACLYTALLPDDLPGFFARYPAAIIMGTLIYFLVTIAVEGAYAFRWLRHNGITLARKEIWKGMILANLASYIVLAPLHYYFTQPIQQVRQFVSTADWSNNKKMPVIYVDAASSELKMTSIGGTDSKTLVPFPMRDYLISPDLNICMFRGTNGNLCIYRRDAGRTNLIWNTRAHYFMRQVAFSPSGRYAAFADEDSNTVEVVDLQSNQRIHQPMAEEFNSFYDLSLAWSTNERAFYLKGFKDDHRLRITIRDNAGSFVDKTSLSIEKLTGTNAPPLSACYGRVNSFGSYWSDDWGASFTSDSCGAFSARSEPGLGSSLRIYRNTDSARTIILYLAVNQGLLHIAHFYFGDIAFLTDCDECLFQAEDYIYLLNIPQKKVGTVVRGNRFILLTPRYQKQF